MLLQCTRRRADARARARCSQHLLLPLLTQHHQIQLSSATESWGQVLSPQSGPTAGPAGPGGPAGPAGPGGPAGSAGPASGGEGPRYWTGPVQVLQLKAAGVHEKLNDHSINK